MQFNQQSPYFLEHSYPAVCQDVLLVCCLQPAKSMPAEDSSGSGCCHVATVEKEIEWSPQLNN